MNAPSGSTRPVAVAIGMVSVLAALGMGQLVAALVAAVAGLGGLVSRRRRTTGATQTPDPAPPIPDGATGWPGIRFSVA